MALIVLGLTGVWDRRRPSQKSPSPASLPSPPGNAPALHFGQPPGKALGGEDGRAYNGGMKVSFTCAAARAISSPVAAA